MTKYFQGVYHPKNPSKYKGDVKNIIYRSSYEFSYMRKLDSDPNVVSWSSEETIVAYPCPFDKEKRKWRRYFPDFLVVIKEGKELVTYLVEIKPAFQTKKPTKGDKKQKQYLTEATTYIQNMAKWEAAEAYCRKRGWKFKVLTEKELKIG